MPTPTAFPIELGVYIDKLHDTSASGVAAYEAILGNASKENSLVQWCVDEGFTYVIFYELGNYRSGATFTSGGKTLLSNLIVKFSAAGIRVGGVGSGSTNSIDAHRDFNLTQPVGKKFWSYVFEDEFWGTSGAARVAAFNNIISNIDYANTMLGPIGIPVDVYLGWPTTAEIVQIAQRLPRLFIHDYSLWANYSYTDGRVRDLSDNFPGGYTFLPICSCENTAHNGPDIPGDPSFNFSGYKFEGKNSAGVFVGPIHTILDWWNNYCFTPPGGLGSPNSFQAETYGQVQSRITVGGMILFEQSLMRALGYQHTVALVCGVPSGFTVTAIGNFNATLNWAAATNATGYDVRYRVVGNSIWTNVTNVLTLSLVISGLTAGTNYEFQVSSNCSGQGISSGFSISTTFVTTGTVCAVPGGLFANGIGTTTATVNWSNPPGTTTFNLRYRIVGAGSWTTVNSTTSPKALTGLTAGSQYEFQVQTDCGGGILSAFTSSTLFNTQAAACGIPSGINLFQLGNTFASYAWDDAATAVGYNVRYRVIGAGSWTTDNINNPTSIYDIVNLIPGTDYEFQVQTDCGGSTSSFSASQNFHTPALPVAPIVTPNGTLTLCPGTTITLTSSEPNGNTWSDGSTGNQLIISTAGIYYVIANGLQSLQVVVLAASQVLSTISISGNTTTAQNGSLLTFQATVVNAAINALYKWEINGIDIGNNSNTLINTFNIGDIIQAFVQNPGSCNPPFIASNQLQIQSNIGPDVPTISASGTCIPDQGFVILISSWPGGNQWSNGSTNRSITVYSPGTYTVQAIDSNGIFSAHSIPVLLDVCSVSAVQPLNRVGSDGGFAALEVYPEDLDPIQVRNDNPFSTPGSRVINYGDSLSTLNRQPIKYTASNEDEYHLVTEYDTLWDLAFKKWGNSRLYWIIQDTNDLENSWELPVGQTILLPDLNKIKIQLAE